MNKLKLHNRLRTAKALVTIPKDGQIVACNYLTKQASICEAEDIYWLTVAPD